MAAAGTGGQERPRPLWRNLWPALALLVITLLIGVWRYPTLPAVLPVHFAANGTPNGWEHKSPLTVLLPVLIQAGLIALMGFATWMTRQPDAMRRSGGADLGRPLGRLAAWICLAFLGVWLVVWQMLPQTPLLALGLVLGPVGVGVADLIISTARLTHGAVPQDERRHYKAGLFYYNPEDKRTMVPKRIGVGDTLNFAQKGAWLTLAVLLLLPLAVIALVVFVLQN